MDWKKSITQSRKDAKNTSHGYAIPRLVGLTSKSSLDILATAAACVGLISPGRFFGRPLAVLAAIALLPALVGVRSGVAPTNSQYGHALFIAGAWAHAGGVIAFATIRTAVPPEPDKKEEQPAGATT